MSKININYTNGNIGGVVGSDDFISGLVFDSTLLPTGFANSGTCLAIYSVKDAENIGITNTSIGEVKATGGKITITSGGTVGSTVSAIIAPVYGVTEIIGSYTIKTGDTVSNIATGLGTSINLSANAFTATVATSAVTLSIPSGYGASLNASGLSCSTNGTATVVQFTGGTGSQIDLLHYIISSYFAANQNSKLWLNIADFSSAYNANRISLLQTAAGGEIRQMGIWTKKGLDGISTIVSQSQTVATDQASKKKPLSVVIAAQPGTATLSTLVNLRTLTSPRVSVTISNAYGTDSLGYRLKGINGNFVTNLGELLGHISRSKVSNSIAWVQQNLTQNANTMLVTGEKWIDIEDTTIASELDGKGYIYEGKYFGYAGSYFQNDATCDSLLSDYDSIKRMRTMDKVARIAYLVLVPYLSSPLIINSLDGTISEYTISKFTGVLNDSLEPMFTAQEISGYQVYIYPSQNILTNKELVVSITCVPVGSADQITVNLAYSLSLQ